MGRQLTIFDWMPEKPPDINDISEAEAVQTVGDRLGVKFTYDPFFKDYRAKIGKIILRLSYGHFFSEINNGALYLGADYMYGTSGGGSPCHGIEDAVDYLNDCIEQCRKEKYQTYERDDDG